METTKIKLNEIVEKLKKRDSKNARDIILKTIEIKNYVSYAIKEVTARQIIQTSHFVYPTDNNIDDMSNEEIMNLKGIPYINYSKQYLFTALMLVDLYTNLEIDFSQGVYEYDKLAEYGIMDYIINNINDSEIKEFKMLIDYEYQTYYQKYHSLEAQVNNKFNELFPSAINTINSLIDGMKDIANNKDGLKNLINFANNNK